MQSIAREESLVSLSLQNGWSPLLVASEHGHLDVLKILLQHHARVDVFDEVCIRFRAARLKAEW